MFDSVLGRGQAVQSRFGAGTAVSIVLHAALIAGALYLSGRVVVRDDAEAEVKFIASRPAPPPPPPPPPGGSAQPRVEKRVEKKVVKKPDTIVQPREIPVEKPLEAEPEPADEPADEAGAPGGEEGGQVGGEVGGVVGGVVGGQVGGVLGGQLGGQLGSDVIAFGEGMSRPVADPKNRKIEYTREALEAHVEGTMLVKCVITVEGEVKNCRVVKPLPHMELQVLSTIHGWKFSPVTFGGKAISVDYVIPIRLVLPR